MMADAMHAKDLNACSSWLAFPSGSTPPHLDARLLLQASARPPRAGGGPSCCQAEQRLTLPRGGVAQQARAGALPAMHSCSFSSSCEACMQVAHSKPTLCTVLRHAHTKQSPMLAVHRAAAQPSPCTLCRLSQAEAAHQQAAACLAELAAERSRTAGTSSRPSTLSQTSAQLGQMIPTHCERRAGDVGPHMVTALRDWAAPNTSRRHDGFRQRCCCR